MGSETDQGAEQPDQSKDWWERWHQNLHQEHPEEVEVEYSNRSGEWGQDFLRQPLRLENGVTLTSSSMYSPLAGYGWYNKAALRRRGWTRTAIRRILGDPDRTLTRKRYPKRPECLYDEERVLKAEEEHAHAGKVRFRKRSAPRDESLFSAPTKNGRISGRQLGCHIVECLSIFGAKTYHDLLFAMSADTKVRRNFRVAFCRAIRRLTAAGAIERKEQMVEGRIQDVLSAQMKHSHQPPEKYISRRIISL